MTLTKDELAIVDAMIHTREIGAAAIQCGLSRYRAVSISRRPHVAEEIERRQKIEGAEVAKIVARKRIVNIEALDKNLMQVVKLPVAALKESPTLAASKVKAIELGFQRIGMLIDGNFVPDESSINVGKGAEDGPRIFRATNTTMLTHTIETKETRQVVHHSNGPTEPPPIDIPAEDSPFNY